MNLLVAHMVGDYLFQNRWMATNKAKYNGSIALATHCLIYTLSVYLFTGWSFKFLWIIYCSHAIMDALELGKVWRRFFSRDEEIPWSITSDNTIHLLILWLISLYA
jgi:hypothetical protein